MICRCLLMTVLFLTSLPVLASDSPIYESIRGVSIGRVFLTQERRDALDKRRLQLPRPAPAATRPAGRTPDKNAPPPAGYIIGPSGRSKTWRNGDFVETARKSVKRMPFPGDVSVKRHPAPAENVNDGDAD